jgi:hypothetical protein
MIARENRGQSRMTVEALASHTPGADGLVEILRQYQDVAVRLTDFTQLSHAAELVRGDEERITVKRP